MKKLLLGPPLLPSPITKVGQAGSRGVRAGWTERGLVAATGFPSGDHEEAWVGAGSPLSLVFGNQCCLSPPPPTPVTQGSRAGSVGTRGVWWRTWEWRLREVTGASCFCGAGVSGSVCNGVGFRGTLPEGRDFSESGLLCVLHMGHTAGARS